MQEVWKKYAAVKGEHPFNAETTIDFLDPNKPEISFNYTCLNNAPLIDYYKLEKMESQAYFFHLFVQYLALVFGTLHYMLIFNPFVQSIISALIPYAAYTDTALVGPAIAGVLIISLCLLMLCFYGWTYALGQLSLKFHNSHKWLRDNYAKTNAFFRIPIKHKIDLGVPATRHHLINHNTLTYFKVSYLQFDLIVPDEVMAKIKTIKTIASENRKSISATGFYLIVEFSEIPKEGTIILWS